MLALKIKLGAATIMIAYLRQTPCVTRFHLGLDVDGSHATFRRAGLTLGRLRTEVLMRAVRGAVDDLKVTHVHGY